MKNLLVIAIGSFLVTVSAQEIPNGGFSEGADGWNLVAQGGVKAVAEVVADGIDGKTALKVAVSESPEASWWMLRLSSRSAISLEPGVTYLLSFSARCEGSSRSIEVGLGADGKKIADRQKFKLVEEWQEFLLPFTVESATESAHVVFDNLAAPEAVYYFANVRLSKE